ncbi:hypothetical protein ES319_D10G175900v1 [Gossypium barbadense]|uniref:Uncharacterized protein n=1 Tax=Gossypium barbadense TaxID=3634 RepID=A0A5J5PT60_GOSBA|nr:hypothetical protein ES319_D10G175900v1 [Gossypium barbadense]
MFVQPSFLNNNSVEGRKGCEQRPPDGVGSVLDVILE